MSPGFSTTSSGPRKEQTPEVVVVEADPGEVRVAQLRKQEKQIDDLRDALDANRARADEAARRSDAASLKALSAVEAMESQLAEQRLRADSAVAQADRSFALAKEFLSNIVAAREEQSAMLQRNTGKFDRVDERLAEMERSVQETRQLGQSELAAAERTRASDMQLKQKDTDQQLSDLRAQLLQANLNYEELRKRGQAELAAARTLSSNMEQRLKDADQKVSDLRAQMQQSNRQSEEARRKDEEMRRLGQAELAATIARSVDMEKKLKGTDKQLSDMREQLLLVNRNIEDTRAAIGSGPMLDMMRRLESTQRETSGLRGLIEEMQKEQEVARKRLQDYYLDLDARIQDLQKRERAAREAAEARRRDAENASMPAPQDVEIPVTEPTDTGDKDGGGKRGSVDVEGSVSHALIRRNQIEAIPLPGEI